MNENEIKQAIEKIKENEIETFWETGVFGNFISRGRS
jgi:hypothetical protein